MFYTSKQQVKITRTNDFVEVRVPGKRQKLIGKTPMPVDEIAWYVRLTTIPRNEHNKLGIVVVDLKPESVNLNAMAQQDRIEASKARARARRAQREQERQSRFE